MLRPKFLAMATFLTFWATSCVLFAQEKLTEHTLKLADGMNSPPAKIADVAWIAGHWQGEAFGGWCEEIWTPPQGGGMLGMYRLIKDGQPVFFELLTLSEVGHTLLLRLKHFHPDLKGWEEKEETVDFPLVSISENEVYFDGMTFRKSNQNEIIVYLAMQRRDGPVSEETFTYKRGGQ